MTNDRKKKVDYWDVILEDEDGRAIESPASNPDVIAEEDGLYFHELNDEVEFRLEVIEELAPKLSVQERRILNYIGILGYTLEKTADIMGIKVRTVRTFLERLRKKAERQYKLKQLKDQ